MQMNYTSIYYLLTLWISCSRSTWCNKSDLSLARQFCCSSLNIQTLTKSDDSIVSCFSRFSAETLQLNRTQFHRVMICHALVTVYSLFLLLLLLHLVSNFHHFPCFFHHHLIRLLFFVSFVVSSQSDWEVKRKWVKILKILFFFTFVVCRWWQIDYTLTNVIELTSFWNHNVWKTECTPFKPNNNSTSRTPV